MAHLHIVRIQPILAFCGAIESQQRPGWGENLQLLRPQNGAAVAQHHNLVVYSQGNFQVIVPIQVERADGLHGAFTEVMPLQIADGIEQLDTAVFRRNQKFIDAILVKIVVDDVADAAGRGVTPVSGVLSLGQQGFGANEEGDNKQ